MTDKKIVYMSFGRGCGKTLLRVKTICDLIDNGYKIVPVQDIREYKQLCPIIDYDCLSLEQWSRAEMFLQNYLKEK